MRVRVRVTVRVMVRVRVRVRVSVRVRVRVRVRVTVRVRYGCLRRCCVDRSSLTHALEVQSAAHVSVEGSHSSTLNTLTKHTV